MADLFSPTGLYSRKILAAGLLYHLSNDLKQMKKARMTQEFIVVRCFSCEVFQCHQARKDKKFVCKMCGEKQSVRKEYGRGSGSDCRLHVQRLNGIRRGIAERKEAELEAQMEMQDEEEEEEEEEEMKGMYQGGVLEEEEEESECHPKPPVPPMTSCGKTAEEESRGKAISKWSKYLSSDSSSDSD